MPDANQSATPGPLVSVAMTTYQRAPLLPRALDSVLAQTYQNLEVIVVDDGSTDDTQELLKQYCARDARIRVIRHEANRGVAAAKNTSVQAATGEYTIVFDSDDELVPHAIERMVTTLLDLGPEYGMVFANCVDPDTGTLTGLGLSQSGEITYEDAICRRFKGEYVGLWRTSLIEGLAFDEEIQGGETLTFVWWEFYKRTRVYYIHEALRKYYRGAGTMNAVSTADSREAWDRHVVGQNAYIEHFHEEILRVDRQCLGREYRVLALYYFLAGRRVQSARAVIRALRYAPGVFHAALLTMPLMPERAVTWALQKRTSAFGIHREAPADPGGR